MTEHTYDLVIVGAGSGNMVLTKELAGWRTAVVEASRFGGTCLNRGCIPSKMLVLTADIQQRFDVRLGVTAERVAATPKGVCLSLASPAGAQRAEAEVLLVATGRVPNSDRLDVAAAGVEVDPRGHVRTDDTCTTSVPGIWALGDLANHFQLKHMANAEARLVRYNLLHPDRPRRARFTAVPSAVFADPQVASVGATEQELQALGRPYATATRFYRDTAYGWALEDTTSFVKILADPATRLLLGAHIIGPQASTLIQPLIQAMCLSNTVDQLASSVLYIHPALTEAVEQALLEL